MRFSAALACWLTLAASASAETFLILPFSNLSNSQNLDWVGESIAESIRDALATEGLLALGREDREEAFRRLAIRPYRPMTKASAMRVAEMLDADQVIFGSFELSAPEPSAPKGRGTLRIDAQVVDLRKARKGAEYTDTGALEDLARLQRHVAWEALRAVAPRSAPSEEDFLRRTPVTRIDALERYTRGLVAASTDQKLRLFSEAVRLDPNYFEAWFQLGKEQLGRRDYRAASQSLARVSQNETHFREAQFYLGISRYMHGDHAGAQKAFETVAAVVPLNEVWNNLGVTQLRRNASAAMASFEKALEGDPSDPDYHYNMGLALFSQGKYDVAAERFRAALDRNPEDRDAAAMLDRCTSGASSRRAAAGPESPGRLKQSYEESAYLQLKAVLEGKTK